MSQVSLNSTGVASAGALVLQSNGTTAAVTVDTSQNVGIGTSSPTKKLSVVGSGNDISSGAINTVNSNAGTVVQTGLYVSNGTQSAQFSLAGTGYSGYGAYTAGNAFVYNDQAITLMADNGSTGIIKFATGGNSERARIDSSGRFLLGTTSTILSGSNLLCASSSGYTAAFSTSGGASYHALGLVNTGTTGTRYFAQFFAGATPTNTGGISTADGTTTVYATSSDYRLKENISPMTGALATVAQLKPVNYTWKATGHSTQGFIAHELHAVVPECVVGEKDAVDVDGNPVYQGIDTSFLVATLTAAIQEQQAQISSQAAVITTLTERISALEA
jgi:Chaperone of endosialidase